MSYILFFSNHCPYSKKFIKFFEQTEIALYIVRICVDKNEFGERPKQIKSYGITEVPTIIVDNNRLSGIDAFTWLKKTGETDDTLSTTHTRLNKSNLNEIKNEQNNEQPGNGPLPFDNNFSNNFSSGLVDLNNINRGIPTSNDENIDKKTVGRFNLQDDNITSMVMNTKKRVVNDSHLPTISVKKDNLKMKQMNNEYNKMLQERGLETC